MVIWFSEAILNRGDFMTNTQSEAKWIDALNILKTPEAKGKIIFERVKAIMHCRAELRPGGLHS